MYQLHIQNCDGLKPLGIRLGEFQSQRYHLLPPEWQWASYLTSLSLCFLTLRMKITVLIHCEEEQIIHVTDRSTVPARSKYSVNANCYYDNLYQCLHPKTSPIQVTISHMCMRECTHVYLAVKITWMTQLGLQRNMLTMWVEYII